MRPKITVWRVIFVILALAGLYSTYLRVMYGLGGSTNLSDQFPWGIWIGFDILCGVGLAAGGFTLVAVVHIFNLKRYHPILRPAILTAFLGYVLVVLALLFDLGRPDRLWHPLVMWNPHSVMFEVAWCVTLYTTVLALEFMPAVLEKFALHKSLKVVRAISVPLMIAGVILSTLHQSSLGSLYLIVPHKLYALWYTPLLPVLFYISAIGAGLAMTIFESWHSSKAFGRQLELPLVAGMARVLAVVVSVYLTIRYLDLSHRGALALLTQNRTETWLFALEILLMASAMVLLFQRRVRQSPAALYWCAVLYLFGFITNRLNVAVTGMESASGTHYIPKWTEMSVTLGIVALGFAIFRVVAHYFPIFEKPEEPARPQPEPVLEPVLAYVRAPTSLAPTSLAPTSLTPTSLVPASLVPASVVPASLVPASVVPASVVPASVVPASVVPASLVPASLVGRTPWSARVPLDPPAGGGT